MGIDVMRIILYTEEYYPTCAACSYRMQVMADAFIQQGQTVTVLTSARNKDNGSTQGRQERILYSPAIRMKKKTTIMRLLNNLSFGISSVFTAMRAGKADIVIVTSPPPLSTPFGGFIARCKRAKLVYDVRDIWPDVALEMGSFAENSFFCKIFRRITNKLYKKSDLITTVSPGKVEKIKNKVANLPGRKSGPEHTDKVKFVGNGFDETILKDPIDQELIDKYQLNKNFTCVYIGNIGLAQGLDSLLTIAKETKHKDVRFLLFGTGAEKDMLVEKAKELGNVQFCGVLPHEKVRSLLTAAKISFIPLKNSNMKDSIPTKIYEALGNGCPVLLMAEGDSCDIVNASGLGKTVSPDHPELLAGVFDSMVDHYDEYETRKQQAMHLMVEEYSRQKIAERFVKELMNGEIEND